MYFVYGSQGQTGGREEVLALYETQTNTQRSAAGKTRENDV